MQYEPINTDAELVDYCRDLASAPYIAFDTEFVSEDRYRPDLCLVQVESEKQLAVIDPQGIQDMQQFWQLLAEPKMLVIVHAGREELRFCLHAIGCCPPNMFDIQLAAGMVGLEYPAAYSTLVSKLLGKSLRKGETRTNWRKRPLTERQIEYALQDVLYLKKIYDQLSERVEKLGRTTWLSDEIRIWQEDVANAENSERWQRVSGIAGLSTRSLAIVRELWRWREQEARQRDAPPRRVLRDDLIVELARRQVADTKQIRALRGMDRRDIQKHLDGIAAAIDRALQLPGDECPRRSRSHSGKSQFNLVGQFVSSALAGICRAEEIAPGIVGTTQDVRDLLSYKLEPKAGKNEKMPALAEGWRGDLVGRVIQQLLEGKLAIRITDPFADQPLTFEPATAAPASKKQRR